MQIYQAKIDEEISSLMTTTQEHIDSQNQAVVACRSIAKEVADTEVFLYFQKLFSIKNRNSYTITLLDSLPQGAK